jgi:tetratricopeptide (TPR) repeat protein
MTYSPSLQKASLLIGQSRYDLAEKELRSILVQEPHHVIANRLLATCLLNQHRDIEALEVTSHLVGTHPDDPDNLYMHAISLLHTDKDREAERFIRDAISLYPQDADYFELLSRIYLSRKEWEQALQFANEGLQIDPDHIGCLNTRTMSFTKLNRKEEARQTIDSVLQQDPENAHSHANVGWSKLEQGDYTGAQVHFAEALRLQPSLDYARAGMLEALKAKNLLYRLFLNFFFWLAKFKGKAQWGIIIAFYIGNRLLRTAATTYPVLIPVAILVSLFFYLTWIIEPLFNLFLRLDKYGKYVLNEREIAGANWVGLLLGTALVALGIGYFGGIFDFFALAFFAATMVIPTAHLYSIRTEKEKRIIKPYTIALTGVGLLGLVCMAFNIEAMNMLGTVYLFGIVAFGWVANGLAIR